MRPRPTRRINRRRASRSVAIRTPLDSTAPCDAVVVLGEHHRRDDERDRHNGKRLSFALHPTTLRAPHLQYCTSTMGLQPSPIVLPHSCSCASCFCHCRRPQTHQYDHAHTASARQHQHVRLSMSAWVYRGPSASSPRRYSCSLHFAGVIGGAPRSTRRRRREVRPARSLLCETCAPQTREGRAATRRVGCR
jgi:hypothetical protein